MSDQQYAVAGAGQAAGPRQVPPRRRRRRARAARSPRRSPRTPCSPAWRADRVAQVLVVTDDARFSRRARRARAARRSRTAVTGDLNAHPAPGRGRGAATLAGPRRRWRCARTCPALRAEDLDAALARGAAATARASSPDAAGVGTTLYVAPYDEFDPRFGPGSRDGAPRRRAPSRSAARLASLRRDVDDLGDLRGRAAPRASAPAQPPPSPRRHRGLTRDGPPPRRVTARQVDCWRQAFLAEAFFAGAFLAPRAFLAGDCSPSWRPWRRRRLLRRRRRGLLGRCRLLGGRRLLRRGRLLGRCRLLRGRLLGRRRLLGRCRLLRRRLLGRRPSCAGAAFLAAAPPSWPEPPSWPPQPAFFAGSRPPSWQRRCGGRERQLRAASWRRRRRS